MPSFEHRPRGKQFNPLAGKGPFTPPPKIGPSTPPPDLSIFAEPPTMPLPVPVSASQGGVEEKDTQLLPAPRTTRQLVMQSSPGVTRLLTGTLSRDQESPSPRGTTVIKGEMKRKTTIPISQTTHRKRRLMVSLAGVLALLMITAFALLATSPLGREIGLNFNGQQGSSMVTYKNSDPKLIAQATATAVSQQQNDGYDPFSGGTITVTNGSGSLNWPVGQCTYWANYRYHELTGFWVSWTGNAYQWVAGARAAGWNVSQTPHVPSIIVLGPYVQGAWGYGHVAVVENIVDGATPTTVHTSNMNWWNNGGGWNRVSYADFTVGNGVWFVWHS